jgi:hypothetical protein
MDSVLSLHEKELYEKRDEVKNPPDQQTNNQELSMKFTTAENKRKKQRIPHNGYFSTIAASM